MIHFEVIYKIQKETINKYPFMALMKNKKLTDHLYVAFSLSFLINAHASPFIRKRCVFESDVYF